ncbi:hypothetical protein [Bordetella avium]|uniref:hypothetical protein n=1 Tax=Bordetella avium TaxID=521 RepID=UPI000E67C73B|nr:hypothetical protein [Bordetella avium]RIQ55316.1 hypothetical protein D0841_16490 [Bordetella avium]
MRQDQYERLLALQEKLIDALVLEMDPETWPGAGMLPSAMDQQTRGDRYWAKKNLAATQSVVMRNASLIGVVQRQTAGNVPGGGAEVTEGQPAADDGGLDAEIQNAEREAARVLARVQKVAGTR